MSILLEALKKSEAQRQIGRTPTLQTPGDLPAAAQRPAGRWLGSAMAILAVLVMAWTGWTQFRPPAGEPAGRLRSADRTDDQPAAAVAGERETGREAAADTPDFAPEQRPLASMGAQPQSSGEDVEERRRLLGKTFRSYSAGQEGETEAEAGSRDVAEVTRVAPAPGSGQAPATQPALVAAPAVIGEPEPRLDPPAEATISYWQMPLSLREGLPELRIRVLVYADRSEDRFLLLNDTRLHEGEELEPGLRLEEIQRDRAIFSYRNYRFHLKS
jgi:general secretion pathway protein B